jgi:hypothetical protein
VSEAHGGEGSAWVEGVCGPMWSKEAYALIFVIDKLSPLKGQSPAFFGLNGFIWA